MSQLMSALTGGMLAPMLPPQQPMLPPLFSQQLPPLQQPTPPPPTLPILPEQPIAEPPSTKVMDTDVGAVEAGQSDEQMTDGSGVQQLGSKGPTEDAKET